MLRWPSGSSSLSVEMIEDLFLEGTVLLTVEASFDGILFRTVSTDKIESPVTAPRDFAAAASIALSFNPRPTHVRISLDRVSGTPVIGCRSDAEEEGQR